MSTPISISPITTHILDVSVGRPATRVPCVLERADDLKISGVARQI